MIDDLHLGAVALGEERADRAVGQARGEDGVLGRATFALDEAARDLAGGVHPLLVVDCEGEEVEPSRGFRSPTAVERTTAVAVADGDGAVGKAGHPADFKDHLAARDRQAFLDGRWSWPADSGLGRVCSIVFGGLCNRSITDLCPRTSRSANRLRVELRWHRGVKVRDWSVGAARVRTLQYLTLTWLPHETGGDLRNPASMRWSGNSVIP